MYSLPSLLWYYSNRPALDFSLPTPRISNVNVSPLYKRLFALCIGQGITLKDSQGYSYRWSNIWDYENDRDVFLIIVMMMFTFSQSWLCNAIIICVL